ncbi:MAG: hypothetical protein HW394_703 [Acidobacteria bacterium]|nr:hypothetical protein [Acidobacteriota bacterium]
MTCSAARKLAAEAPLAEAKSPATILNAIQDWYEPHVGREIEHVRLGILAITGPERALLDAVFSSLLIKSSVRTIDTSEPTDAAASAAGLCSIARASLDRPDAARETTRWEHVFAFKKEKT